jgi:predicted RNase H-like nuclease
VDGDRVLGVDACRAGWVGIALGAGPVRGYVAATIEELVAVAEGDGRIAVVGVDMPIGLPDHGRRAADILARQAIGTLRSSVFMTPVRIALDAPDHATASERNRALAGEGMSIQAFGLRPKLLQVDRWVRTASCRPPARERRPSSSVASGAWSPDSSSGRPHRWLDPASRSRGSSAKPAFPRGGPTPAPAVPHGSCRVVEVHPEVSFAHLAGAPLTVRKHTWAGMYRRRELLAGAGIRIDGDLGEAGRGAAVDDVLDAAVCAWTARRVARGEARCMPDPPERFSDGIPCAIWT